MKAKEKMKDERMNQICLFDLYVLDTLGGKLKFTDFPLIKMNIY